MVITGPATVDEMVASFLLAELDSDRWADGYVVPRLAAHGWPDTLIRRPNLADAEENRRRAELLGEYRGWGTGAWLFPGFPPDVDWHRGELAAAEVGEVLGARYEDWILLSGGSRRVADCARHAIEGPVVDRLGVVAAALRGHWIARRYLAGDVLEPPIIVAPRSGSPLVAIEGHTRLIGSAIAGRPDPLPVIVGLSDRIAEWTFF